MNRILAFAAALVLVFAAASSANAACQEITIGASITVLGIYQNNMNDYSDNAKDNYSALNGMVDIYLDNMYTDNVCTKVKLNLNNWISDAANQNVQVDYAYIQFKEFLAEGMTFEIGKITWNWQLRPSWGAGTFEKLYPEGVSHTFVLARYAMGMGFAYNFTEDITLTFGFQKVQDNILVPAESADLDLYVVRYDQKLGEMNKMFAAFLYYNDQNEFLPGNIWMLNAGIDYFVMEENLELYFELCYQDGDAHAAGNDIGTFAINAGLEYTFKDIDTTPYLGLDITMFTGTEAGAPATLAYNRYGASWTQTLIAENDFFGGLANWTPGWMGVKLLGGMKSINNDKFAIDFVLGFFKADGDLVPAARGDGLGMEIDIVASYMYSEDVTFTLGFGYFDPDEDLAGPNPDGVWTMLFGCNIVF